MTILPHVTIYKFPVTAISSIFNRITGVILSGGFVLTGSSLLIPDFNTKAILILKDFKEKNPESDKNIKKALFFTTSTISVYHILGGIRHFIWDKYPLLLNNKSVSKSSFFIGGISCVIGFINIQFIE